MKTTDKTNQPKHTQGKEWKVFDAFARFEIRGDGDKNNIAEVYDRESAERIVKCCNNEWKIDMHDELIEAVRHASMSCHHPKCEFPKGHHKKCTCHVQKAKNILKQTEGK